VEHDGGSEQNHDDVWGQEGFHVHSGRFKLCSTGAMHCGRRVTGESLRHRLDVALRLQRRRATRARESPCDATSVANDHNLFCSLGLTRRGATNTTSNGEKGDNHPNNARLSPVSYHQWRFFLNSHARRRRLFRDVAMTL
jgi:hypothetical protein